MTYYDYHFREEELREGCIRSVDNVKGLSVAPLFCLKTEIAYNMLLVCMCMQLRSLGKHILKKYITKQEKISNTWLDNR